MTAARRANAWIGRSVRRTEDLPLVTGRGRFIDDLSLPHQAHAAIVRSDHAHARIVAIDLTRALAVDGVLGAFTGAELLKTSPPYPVGIPNAPRCYAAAIDKVRFVGEPVAVVVAEDRYRAEDAAQAVTATYDDLPAVVDPDAALQAAAPILHEELGTNKVWQRSFRHGDPASVFAAADVTVRHRFGFPRYSSTPIETFGVIAAFDDVTGDLTLWSNLQGIYANLYVLARSLGIRENKLRVVIAQHVGGSFGIKASVYPYMTLIGLAAMRTRRPVKWIETRREHLTASSCHADRIGEIEVAADRTGVMTGMRLSVIDNVGAYIRTPEPACSLRAYSSLNGPYGIRNIEYDATIVHTNKMPSGSNRGYGSPQHNFPLERAVDLLARELAVDPAELRLRNLISASDMPYTTVTGGIYDSGDYSATLRKALEIADYRGLRSLQHAARNDGRHVGVGVAVGVDPSTSNLGYITLAYTPEQRRDILPKSGSLETVAVALDGNGQVNVTLCTAPHGQGHDTIAAQIAADRLGVDPGEVVVTNEFDTLRSAWTFASGTYSSRFGAVGVSAIAVAVDRLRSRIAAIAAHLMEASPEDVEFVDGRISIKGASHRSVSLRQVARQSQWNAAALQRAGIKDPLLRVVETFMFTHLEAPDDQDRVNAFATYAFIAEVVAVEVFPETGEVEILRYATVHDAGTIINPMIVQGQIHGSVLHGVGGALYEEMPYDAAGQPLAATFMDYACPTAAQAPPLRVGHIESPSPFTTLGSKGMGEGSAEVAPVVIANAVADALDPLGVPIHDLPLTPFKMWSAMRRYREKSGGGSIDGNVQKERRRHA